MKAKTTIRLIVGMSRAGTTSMARTLNQHRDAVAFGETLYWGNYWIKPVRGKYEKKELDKLRDIYTHPQSCTITQGGESAEATSPMAVTVSVLENLDKLEIPATPLTAFQAIGKAVAMANGKKIWIEKTPHHLMHMDRILNYTSDLRAIVQLRDPREFMLSYKYQGSQHGESVRDRFRRTYHPAMTALICRGYLKAAYVAKKKNPDVVKIVWLDALAQDDGTILKEVLEHLKLDPQPNLQFSRGNSSFKQETVQHKLEAEDLIWLKIFTDRMSREFHLSSIKAPFAPFVFIYSILKLVPWSIRIWKFHSAGGFSLVTLARRWLTW